MSVSYTHLDLPGFKKEDIKIEVDNHYLTIHAQRHCAAEEKDQQGNYLRCERTYGSYARSFDISEMCIRDSPTPARVKGPPNATGNPAPAVPHSITNFYLFFK